MSVNRSRRRVTLSHVGALEQIRSILMLGEEEVVGGTRDRDPKEMMEIPEIFHGELGVKKLGDATKKPSRRSCQNDVVDVEQQVGDVDPLFVDKERCIGGRRGEPKPLKEAREALVPCSGRLLEPI
jgi:hypothetical protein